MTFEYARFNPSDKIDPLRVCARGPSNILLLIIVGIILVNGRNLDKGRPRVTIKDLYKTLYVVILLVEYSVLS